MTRKEVGPHHRGDRDMVKFLNDKTLRNLFLHWYHPLGPVESKALRGSLPRDISLVIL
jgi:hypothetical protein